MGLLVLALLSYWTMAVDAAQAAAEQRAEEEKDDAKADAKRSVVDDDRALETAPVQLADGKRTRVLGVVKETKEDPERKRGWKVQ